MAVRLSVISAGARGADWLCIAGEMYQVGEISNYSDDEIVEHQDITCLPPRKRPYGA